MDKAKYEQALSIFSKVRLDKSLKEMMSVAEDAWFAQAQAVRAIDHRSDEVAGEDRLVDLEFALEQWILELEIISNAAKKIAKRANRTLHTGGDYPEVEVDGEEYGDNGEGVEVVEANAATGSDDRRRSRRNNGRHRIVGAGSRSGRKKFDKDFRKDAERRQQVSEGKY